MYVNKDQAGAGLRGGLWPCSGRAFLILEGCGLSHFGFAQCRLWQRRLPAISPETFCQESPVGCSFRGNFGAEMTTNLR